MTIPKSLLRGNPWKIMLGSKDITSQAIINKNDAHTSMYFTYTHSNYNVQIIGTEVIPEFSLHSALILALIFTFAIILSKIRLD